MYWKLNVQEARRHLEGVAVVAVFLTINDELPNTELEKIGEVLPRIEVKYLNGLLEAFVNSWHQVKGEESQTAEVVNVEALLPQNRDYLTYQANIFTWIQSF